MTNRTSIAVLTAGWLVVAGAFLWAGHEQRQRINLSATAGGQFPYLAYARGIADQGITSHFGDRNRMPLVPTAISLAYHPEPQRFFERATLVSIALSMASICLVAAAAYWSLPLWPATFFTLLATVCVYLPKASIIQAELPYYSFFFLSWLLLCRLLNRPSWRSSLLAGVAIALAYYAKSSAVPLLMLFLGLLLARSVIRFFHSGSHAAARFLVSGTVVTLTFLLLAATYLVANDQAFGRPFYNVNSTFFMWLDNWTQARQFAEQYDITRRYPDAPPDQLPGPLSYWRTHSLDQVGSRLAYGFHTLGLMAIHGNYAKYVLAIGVILAILAWTCRRRLPRILIESAWPAALTVLMLAGYLLAYAWYVPVAYGDRFLLSLLLPLMFSCLWLASRLTEPDPPLNLRGYQVRPLHSVSLAGTAALLIEGALLISGPLYEPTREFITFYYNETRERLDAGDLPEARRGFEGVTRLDPSFAPAYLGLGMVAILQGRPEQALAPLREAVRLRPDQPDVHNSLGSALLATGQGEEAVAAFRRAVELEPAFASAWYNLGGTLATLGRYDEAREIVPILDRLAPPLAEQLRDLFPKS